MTVVITLDCPKHHSQQGTTECVGDRLHCVRCAGGQTWRVLKVEHLYGSPFAAHLRDRRELARARALARVGPLDSLYNLISAYKTASRAMLRAGWQRMAVDGGTTRDDQRWRLFFPAHPYAKRTEL